MPWSTRWKGDSVGSAWDLFLFSTNNNDMMLCLRIISWPTTSSTHGGYISSILVKVWDFRDTLYIYFYHMMLFGFHIYKKLSSLRANFQFLLCEVCSKGGMLSRVLYYKRIKWLVGFILAARRKSQKKPHGKSGGNKTWYSSNFEFVLKSIK